MQFQKYTEKSIRGTYAHGQKIGYNIDHEPTLKPSRDQKRRNRMRFVQARELQLYRTPNGQEPFTEWLKSLRDQRTRKRIQNRIARIVSGNLGDHKSVGDGVFELRLDFGPGYRIYFGEVDNTIILLLCGGDKSSQNRDIERAKVYWQEYKESQE